MKKPLYIALLFVLMHVASAQSGTQWLQQKVSISVQEKPLAEVLKGLEKDLSGMVFAYSPGSFDVNRKVSVKLDSVTLEEVLKEVFSDQPLECAEIKGKVFLKKKKQTGNSGGYRTVPNRRRRVLSADASVRPVVNTGATESATRAVQSAEVSTEQNRQVRESQEAENTGELTIGDSRDVSRQPDKEEVSSTGGSKSIMMLDSGLRQSMSATAASDQFPPVSDIQLLDLDVQAVNRPQQRLSSFEQPSLPPVPFDSSQIGEPLLYKLGIFKLPDAERSREKERKKKERESDDNEKKLRIYAASTTGLTGIGDEAAIKIGGRAVWLKNKRLGFGLAGYAIQGPNTLDRILDGEYRLAGGYGGVHVEYNLNPNNFLHLSFPLLLAGGGMTYVEQETANLGPGRVNAAAEAVFVVEPGVSLEMHVIKYLKVGFDLAYRFSSNAGLQYDSGGQILENSGLNALSAALTIKFGIF